MNKAKGRQSKAHASRYSAQVHTTAANKKRRAKKREQIANSPKTEARKLLRMAKNVAKGIPRKNPRTNKTPKGTK